MTQGSHNFVTSDRCVEMETVLFSLPGILAFEIEKFCIPAIAAILGSKGSRLSMTEIEASLSKDIPLLYFATIIIIIIKFFKVGLQK